MSELAEPTIDLGHEVTCGCSFPGDNSVRAQTWWSEQSLLDTVLTTDKTFDSRTIDTAALRSSVRVDIDFLAGELAWTANVSVSEASAEPADGAADYDAAAEWTTLVDIAHEVLVRIDPCVGLVAGEPTGHPPVLVSTQWGPSGTSAPGVTRIHIDDQQRQLTDVGSIVKAEMFEAYSPFMFNTLACCGQVPQGQPGVYSDPDSIWFNVFFGVYQLDCAFADGWTRPFGYESDAGVTSVVRGEDLVRLGKSDWNWFSNFLYGVPAEFCKRYSEVDMSVVTFTDETTQTIGSSAWHHVTMSGIEVSTCYQSDARGAARLVENSVATDIWRDTFGLPCPLPDHPVSFVPTTLVAGLDMAYWRDDTAFHTLVFGGTANLGSDPAFLAAQVQASHDAIAKWYPSNGFAVS